jgi:hypothetical protein
MKTLSFTSFVVIILLSIFGFSEIKGDQISQKQQEQAKKEILTVFDSIMKRMERLDAPGLMEYYWPNFEAYGVDGKKYSLQQVKDQYGAFFKSCKSYIWTTYNLEFIVITRNMVVIKVDGKNESIFKSGSKLIYDPSHYTFAFEKIENQWKLCYHHFSGTIVK